MTDRIVLRGLEVMARHGVLDVEKTTPQRFLIDLELVVDLRSAGVSDDLAHTIDYAGLAEAVAARVQGESWNLIERVAQRVADLVLEQRWVGEVSVTVHKPEAPISLDFADVSVTITRQR